MKKFVHVAVHVQTLSYAKYYIPHVGVGGALTYMDQYSHLGQWQEDPAAGAGYRGPVDHRAFELPVSQSRGANRISGRVGLPC